MFVTRRFPVSVSTFVHVAPWSSERQIPWSSDTEMPYVTPVLSTAINVEVRDS